MNGMIYAFVTATRVKWEATVAEYAEMVGKSEREVREDWQEDSDYDESTDTIRLEEPIEEDGWIDPRWSMFILEESRNYVHPLFMEPEDSEDLADEVRDALDRFGAFEDNGDGTFYASDPQDEGVWRYDYAIHFTRKFFGPRGWTEEAWHPKNDGNIDI